jgi:CubicO group peptidase (beta-lactamase class C family)
MPVPKQLDAVELSVGDTPIRGRIDPDFEPVLAAFVANFERGEELGAAVAVEFEGRPVVDLWGGHSDRARERYWSEDSLVNLMSVGKIASALAIFWLLERGTVDLEAPVARYWPEFAAAGKAEVPLQWVLDHRAGLPVLEPKLPRGDIYHHERMATALGAQAPLWKPGERAGYHILTQGFILSEVIRRVDGRSLGRLFHEEFAVPLELDYWIGLPEREHSRCVEFVRASQGTILEEAARRPDSWQGRAWAQVDEHEDFNSARWRSVEIPSANGHGTPRAVARLMSALSLGGTLDGVEVLRPATIARLASEQHNMVEVVMSRAYHQASGVLRSSPPIVWMAPDDSAFGHHGVGGALAVANSDRRFGFAYGMNRMHQRIDNGPRAGTLLKAVYGVIDGRMAEE